MQSADPPVGLRQLAESEASLFEIHQQPLCPWEVHISLANSPALFHMEPKLRKTEIPNRRQGDCLGVMNKFAGKKGTVTKTTNTTEQLAKAMGRDVVSPAGFFLMD